MTHAEAQELLLDLAYGELSAARALEVERHVETCAECTRERAQLAATRRMAAPLAELEEPPPGFDDRILAAARAEASLRADGTPGAVIEVTGSVRPAGLEPALVDPRAPVRTAARAARPRRALRWAAFGSVAAAAALVLAVTSTRGKRPEPAVESSAYEIHIKAPQQQPEPGAAGRAVAPPAPAAAAAAVRASNAPADVEAARQAARTQSEASRQETAERELGGGGDVSDRLAEPRPEVRATGKGLGVLGSREGSAGLAREAAPAAAPPVVIEAERAKKASPDLPRTEAKEYLPPAGAKVAVQAKPAPPERAARQDQVGQPGGAAAALKDAVPAKQAPSAPQRTSAAAPALDQDAAGSLSALSGAAQPVAPALREKSARRAASAPAPMPAEEGQAAAAGAGRAVEPGRIIASTSATRSATAPAVPRAAASSNAPEQAALPSPDALEDAARTSRREANYALAAAQYRKAAQLRQGGADLSTAAWDLAHAIECLSAISQWDEARGVRRELQRLYPGEQSAAAAAARALRPAELAPSSDDSINFGK